MISNIIKTVEENIKDSDAELIVNASDITLDDTERIYASGDIGSDIESEDSEPKDKHNLDPKSESTENDEISDIINIYSY
ncbi:3074_t:CDS:2 [Funneliformis mosseae]|uniref:3074_t:CDS:1 n=1 Tax=Funneliformis mosseae TaxID=27381 RepID=A0A9N9C361_FUNMO|nr:3074_t:CDS:2 [Funneliformis mosseae]